MTIKELIKLLQGYDQDTQVAVKLNISQQTEMFTTGFCVIEKEYSFYRGIYYPLMGEDDTNVRKLLVIG